jgi:PAS domain S-box-containing protein
MMPKETNVDFNKILVVDDTGANRQLLTNLLSTHGYAVYPASDGELALEFVRSTLPDLILLDIRMPGMDGFQVCHRLKADERTRSIPVIFISILEDEREKVRGFHAGAVDYITKPFQAEEVLARVRIHLHLRELTEHLEQKVAERTEELHTVNKQLQSELAERKLVEAQLRKAEEYKAIQNQIAKVFLTIPDEDIYGEVLALVLQAMKSQFGVFGFIETNGDLVIPSMTKEIWSECQVPDKSIIFPPDAWGNSLWGRSITEKKAFISDGPFHTPEGHVPIDNVLAAPIIFGNETIGLLSVANKENGYEEKDQELLESISAYISPILNARLQRDRKEQEREQTEQALSESEERLRLTLEAAQIGIFDWDITLDRWHASAVYYRMLGYQPDDVPGNRLEWLERVHPDDRSKVSEKIQAVLQHSSRDYQYEARLRHADGMYRWQNVRGFGVKRDQEGNITRMLGIRMDITDRKSAEEALRQLNKELDRRVLDRTAQLEAANKELEGFVYSISHDLRAPLRHIDGFIELLQKKAEIHFDQLSRHYMDTISSAARKMALLIDDLLSFSRMGRQSLSFKQVDLGNLVRDTIRELAPDIAGRNIDWRIGDLPVVEGDDAMLRIVLVNLISNALKFTHPREKAQIEIRSLPGKNSETVVFVRDNGVGFDMTYADKLFGVFQRLHRADEFEGTGIGLANVRRIIAQHSGRTWAEGEMDKGATFFFSLPRR